MKFAGLTRAKRAGAVAAATAIAAGAALLPAAGAGPLDHVPQHVQRQVQHQVQQQFQHSSNVASRYVDTLGRPTPHTQKVVTDFANQPWMPPEIRAALLTALNFAAGHGQTGGPDLPQGGPNFRQGYWPTVAPDCMGPGMHSTGSAIAVPGPAGMPEPKPGRGEATFVFTALGTKAAAPRQGQMNAYWVNLSNLRTGVTPLTNNGINPTGPATVSGRAATGSGPVVAVVGGGLATGGKICGFAPTAITFNVP